LISFKQKLVIFLALALAVLLYLAPKQLPEKEPEVISADYTSLIETAKQQISPEQKSVVETLEKQVNDEKDVKRKTVLLDSLRKTWLTFKNQELYAIYGQSIAALENTEQGWMMAGEDFMKAGGQSQNANKANLYKSAIDCFTKVMKMNPSNLAAKTKLGTCYVESASLLGNPPMKGITLLHEVIQQDSANIDANLQLGLFSVTSQQFEKAIDRFRKILRLDSTRIEMYAYLGDTYLSMGNKPKAIESFENYKTRVKDTLIAKNINDYIKKLKQQP